MKSLNKDRLLLVVNPVAGKGKAREKLFDIVAAFSKQGYKVTVMLTSLKRSAEAIAAEEAGSYDLIVALGGDGTLNAVATGVLSSGTDITMGYIPLGSTNDFANSIGIPKKMSEACERIATYAPKRLDLATFNGKNFVYIACSGLFSKTSYSTPQNLKNTLGHSAYIIRGVKDLSETKKMHLRIELENEIIEDDFLFIAVTNSLRAGGIQWLPKEEAVFDDGKYELTLLKAPKKLLDGPILLTDLLTSKADDNMIIRRRVSKATVNSDSPIAWSLDGENGGETADAVIEVREKAISFIW